MTELDNTQVDVEDKSRKRKRPFQDDNKKRMKKSVDIGGQFTLIKNVVPLKVSKVERVLPDWLSNPIFIKRNLKEELKCPKDVCPILHPDLLKRLHAKNITKLFPVQQVLIPYILSGAHGVEHRFPPRDICVATPTGSGKTLAFVVPIVQALGKKSLRSLNAVIILPVKELAKQVYTVFQSYASILNLSVGKAFGGENFENEQNELVHFVYDKYYWNVDILVATPGRLFDHITNTPGMDFTQVRFLVLDEADKLLAGENGELISRIFSSVMQFKPRRINLGLPPFFPLEKNVEPNIYSHLSDPKRETTLIQDKKEKLTLFSRFYEPNEPINIKEKEKDTKGYHEIPCPPVQRLLFSATLTSDPEQLQNVALFRPILFTTDVSGSHDEGSTKTIVEGSNKQLIEGSNRPLELTEEWVQTELSLKPLLLHYIIHKERKKAEDFRCLVFAGSVELTSRLTVLLKALSKGKYVVEEFSSKYLKKRKERISKFLKGKINVLVSTDVMARGVDVPNIDCVISYDVPSAKTYTHRIGRTARAGRMGKAVSIITENELKILKKVLGSNFRTVQERFVREEKLEKFETCFREALEQLSETLKVGARTGTINKTLKRKRNFKNL